MQANWPGQINTRWKLQITKSVGKLSLSSQAEYFSNQLPGVLDNLHRIEIERSHYLKTVDPLILVANLDYLWIYHWHYLKTVSLLFYFFLRQKQLPRLTTCRC